MQLTFTTDVKELRRQLEEAESLVKHLQGAIEAREALCEHDWQYAGHGHCDDINECTKCGATDYHA